MEKTGFVVFPTFGDLGKRSDAAKTLLFCVIKTLSMFPSRTEGDVANLLQYITQHIKKWYVY